MQGWRKTTIRVCSSFCRINQQRRVAYPEWNGRQSQLLEPDNSSRFPDSMLIVCLLLAEQGYASAYFWVKTVIHMFTLARRKSDTHPHSWLERSYERVWCLSNDTNKNWNSARTHQTHSLHTESGPLFKSLHMIIFFLFLLKHPIIRL